MIRLAIDGGEKACPTPIPSWPHYEKDEIDAVSNVLLSGKVNQWTGPEVNKFEAACIQTFQQPYAIAVFNGTLALELALGTLGIGPGDEVIVTPRSFIASASSIVSCGATPVFADIDLLSQNITPETIEAVISPRTKAIVPVHLNGWPCDMTGIMSLAKRHGLMVIEDCAQAHGAKIDGRSVGSFGHAAAFSFCQDKIISTGGEGGMVLFADKQHWQKAWSFKDHGKSYDTVFNKQHPPGFRWLHESFGTNWRMTGLQAAIGLKQLQKLASWHAHRTGLATQLINALAPYPAISVPLPASNMEHAWYRFSFHVDENALQAGWDRKKIMAAISAEGIPCLEVCPEMFKEKAFENIDIPRAHCPNAVMMGNKALLLTVHPTISPATLEMMSNAVKKVLDVANPAN